MSDCYVYDPNRIHAVTSALRYLHRDHLGSVRAETSASKALLAKYDYASFGQRTVKSGSVGQSSRGYKLYTKIKPVKLLQFIL